MVYLRLAFAIECAGGLTCLTVEGIGEVRLVELDVDHFSDLWVVARYLFEVALRRLAQVSLGGVLSSLHQPIELDLLQVVASGSLKWVHARVLDRWEVHVVLLLAISQLDLGGFELTLRTATGLLRHLLLTERDATLLTNLLVEFDHVGFGVFAVALTVTVLVDEDLAPEGVLGHIDALLGLEERLAGELLLSSLLASADDAGSLLLDARDEAL